MIKMASLLGARDGVGTLLGTGDVVGAASSHMILGKLAKPLQTWYSLRHSHCNYVQFEEIVNDNRQC